MARLGRQRSRLSRRSAQSGAVLLALLISLFLVGIGAVVAMASIRIDRQREREAELLFVGDQYRRAIDSYYYASPNPSARSFPTELSQLLEDKRFAHPVRHLRRRYADPMVAAGDVDAAPAELETIIVGGQIVGVRTRVEAKPLKTAGFAAPLYVTFSAARTTRDWAFVALAARAMGMAVH